MKVHRVGTVSEGKCLGCPYYNTDYKPLCDHPKSKTHEIYIGKPLSFSRERPNWCPELLPKTHEWINLPLGDSILIDFLEERGYYEAANILRGKE